MSVLLVGSRIQLTGESKVEDAEALLSLLHKSPGATVDLTEAAHLHGAVVQVLLALRPSLCGPAADAFVAKWLPIEISEKPAGTSTSMSAD